MTCPLEIQARPGLERKYSMKSSSFSNGSPPPMKFELLFTRTASFTETSPLKGLAKTSEPTVDRRLRYSTSAVAPVGYLFWARKLVDAG